MNRGVTMLLISSTIEDHISLTSVSNRSKWEIRHSYKYADGIELLRREPIPVVICAEKLVDGQWMDFMQKAGGLEFPPKIVVSAGSPGSALRSEVQSAGAFDLLGTPFEAEEVFRVGFLAWQSWRDTQFEARRKQLAATAARAADTPPEQPSAVT
jgi:hypothetical protein